MDYFNRVADPVTGPTVKMVKDINTGTWRAAAQHHPTSPRASTARSRTHEGSSCPTLDGAMTTVTSTTLPSLLISPRNSRARHAAFSNSVHSICSSRGGQPTPAAMKHSCFDFPNNSAVVGLGEERFRVPKLSAKVGAAHCYGAVFEPPPLPKGTPRKPKPPPPPRSQIVPLCATLDQFEETAVTRSEGAHTRSQSSAVAQKLQTQLQGNRTMPAVLAQIKVAQTKQREVASNTTTPRRSHIADAPLVTLADLKAQEKEKSTTSLTASTSRRNSASSPTARRALEQSAPHGGFNVHPVCGIFIHLTPPEIMLRYHNFCLGELETEASELLAKIPVDESGSEGDELSDAGRSSAEKEEEHSRTGSPEEEEGHAKSQELTPKDAVLSTDDPALIRHSIDSSSLKPAIVSPKNATAKRRKKGIEAKHALRHIVSTALLYHGTFEHVSLQHKLLNALLARGEDISVHQLGRDSSPSNSSANLRPLKSLRSFAHGIPSLPGRDKSLFHRMENLPSPTIKHSYTSFVRRATNSGEQQKEKSDVELQLSPVYAADVMTAVAAYDPAPAFSLFAGIKEENSTDPKRQNSAGRGDRRRTRTASGFHPSFAPQSGTDTERQTIYLTGGGDAVRFSHLFACICDHVLPPPVLRNICFFLRCFDPTALGKVPQHVLTYAPFIDKYIDRHVWHGVRPQWQNLSSALHRVQSETLLPDLVDSKEAIQSATLYEWCLRSFVFPFAGTPRGGAGFKGAASRYALYGIPMDEARCVLLGVPELFECFCGVDFRFEEE